MNSHDVERAYVQARLDHADRQLDQASAAMRADLDRLAESWRSGAAQQLADHETRMRKLDEDHQAWLRSLYADDDEPALTHELAGAEDAAVSSGHRPQQPNAHEVEMAEAARIRSLSMQDWAVERQRLIRANPGMF